MLQSLQPNSSLQELKVGGYGGIGFPSWVSDLSNLVRIHLIFGLSRGPGPCKIFFFRVKQKCELIGTKAVDICRVMRTKG
jgi:hypothetical protein